MYVTRPGSFAVGKYDEDTKGPTTQIDPTGSRLVHTVKIKVDRVRFTLP